MLGNYQFTAAVNPNSALDKDLGNNNATLILNARTKEDPTYVPSVDCPLITATELDSNTVLQQLRQDGTSNIDGVQRTLYPLRQNGASNIFSRRNTLKGLRIRLDGASTVTGYKLGFAPGTGIIVNNNSVTDSNTVLGDDGARIVGDHDFPKRGVDGYTFTNNVLEITSDIQSFAFSCRPEGKNCKWQNYLVLAVIPSHNKSITTTNVVGAATLIKKQWDAAVESESYSNSDKNSMQVIPATDTVNKELYIRDSGKGSPAQVSDKLVVTVKAGTAASLSYTSTDNYAVAQVRGKTTITENSITVAADAKSTDSVNTQYIQVIVEE